MGLGGDDIAAASTPAASASLERAAADAPATTGAAAPATQTESAPPPPPPVAPYVQAALERKKIPFWAAGVLALLPFWAIVYGLTLDKPSAREAGPRTNGAAVYGQCSSCHGATGGGGVGPQLSGGAVVKQFPKVADHLYWVMQGSVGFKQQGIATYGANKTPVGEKVMPAWNTLKATDLISVIRHEREVFGGEKFDVKEYTEIQAMVDEKYPERSAEFKAAIASYAALPPDA